VPDLFDRGSVTAPARMKRQSVDRIDNGSSYERRNELRENIAAFESGSRNPPHSRKADGVDEHQAAQDVDQAASLYSFQLGASLRSCASEWHAL